MIDIKGLGHINIVVDEINTAMQYYQDLLNAQPIQIFPRFKNSGFPKSAGFLEDPDEVEVSIGFLHIVPENLFLELMEYHKPQGQGSIKKYQTNDMGGVRHVCLQVENIQQAFDFIKKRNDVELINPSDTYLPYKIDAINPDEFKFYDDDLESNALEKQKECDIVSNINYFYFIDQYGVQWELEQGHTDIGN